MCIKDNLKGVHQHIEVRLNSNSHELKANPFSFYQETFSHFENYKKLALKLN